MRFGENSKWLHSMMFPIFLELWSCIRRQANLFQSSCDSYEFTIHALNIKISMGSRVRFPVQPLFLCFYTCTFLLSYYRLCHDLPCSGFIYIHIYIYELLICRGKVNLWCVFGSNTIFNRLKSTRPVYRLVKVYSCLRREECSNWGSKDRRYLFSFEK